MNLYFNEKRDLTESYGAFSNNYHFSLLNESGNEPLHPFFMCKDYYHDLMYTQIYKTKFQIFGYYACSKKDKQFLLKEGMFNLAIRHGLINKSFIPKPDGIKSTQLVRLLNDVETILGLEHSYITYFEKEQFAIINSHTDWLQIPWLQSLYFSLIRVHEYYTETREIKDFLTKSLKEIGSGQSVGQIANLFKRIDFTENFFNNKFDVTNYYSSALKGNSHIIHNILGIVNFITNYHIANSSELSSYNKCYLYFENKKTIKEIIAYTKELYTAKSPASNLVKQE